MDDERNSLLAQFDHERLTMMSDFKMEIKVKDALIKQLSDKEAETREVMRKLLKMIEHPRLLTMSHNALKAEQQRAKEEKEAKDQIDRTTEYLQQNDMINQIENPYPSSVGAEIPQIKKPTLAKSSQDLASVYSPELGLILKNSITNNKTIMMGNDNTRSRILGQSQLLKAKTT